MTHWQNCPVSRRIRLLMRFLTVRWTWLIGRESLLAKQDTPQRLRELLRETQILTIFLQQ